VSGALLVTAEDVPDAGVVERVVGWEVRAAGDAEYGIDASAFRHSMIASTARICGYLLSSAASKRNR